MRPVRLHPDIRFGTERFPEKTARRLRALNLTAWIATALSAGFAVVQFLDPNPGVWRPALVNAVSAPIYAAIPLLHRFGPLAAPLAFAVVAYASIFVLVWLLGTGTDMQFYYLTAVALVILFFGTEQIRLAAAFGAVGAALIVGLEILVPYNTGAAERRQAFRQFRRNRGGERRLPDHDRVLRAA